MDFDRSASRLEKEQEARRLQAKQRADRERRAKAAAAAEAERREAAASALRVDAERAAAARAEVQAAEARQTGGVSYCETLRATPTARDGDRVTLPPSALEALTAQEALDHGPLTFELVLFDARGGVRARTHAGVAEFVAPEGTVGLPPKTALSLARRLDGGADALGSERVRVRYVRLAAHPKSLAVLQPLGEGFHTRGRESIDLDLKARPAASTVFCVSGCVDCVLCMVARTLAASAVFCAWLREHWLRRLCFVHGCANLGCVDCVLCVVRALAASIVFVAPPAGSRLEGGDAHRFVVDGRGGLTTPTLRACGCHLARGGPSSTARPSSSARSRRTPRSRKATCSRSATTA